ncbi:MAG: PelD GGDEF domain-containing protein [Burkholderiaceae bacterium]
MSRIEAVASNPVASRVFQPVTRDWERASALLRILGESVLIVGLMLLLSRWLNPADPFGIHAQYPWIWLGPTILAMRYGTIDGALAAALLLGAWLLPAPYGMTGGPVEPEFPQEYFLGGLVMALIAGQFADVWNNRLSRIKAANAYLDERLVSLTRTHYLIRLSHQRLEQELLVRPVMLSDLLTELRPNTPVDAGRLAKADILLRMLASSCEIESGAIYAMTDGQMETHPTAFVGEELPLELNDPLIEMALDSGRFMHVRATDASLYRSQYLVAGPVRASSGEIIGVMVVRSMPFFALNDENLQFIVVLLGYYADGVMRSQAIRTIQLLRPSVPPDFALELVRMKRLYDQAGIDSSLVAMTFGRGGNGQAIFDLVRRVRRTTDIAWELETPSRHVLLLLLPMSGQAAVDGMLQRIESTVRQNFNQTFAEAAIVVHTTGMTPAEPEWVLDDVLNRCGVNQQIVLSTGRA